MYDLIDLSTHVRNRTLDLKSAGIDLHWNIIDVIVLIPYDMNFGDLIKRKRKIPRQDNNNSFEAHGKLVLKARSAWCRGIMDITSPHSFSDLSVVMTIC